MIYSRFIKSRERKRVSKEYRIPLFNRTSVQDYNSMPQFYEKRTDTQRNW